MNSKEIIQRVTEMVANREMEEFSSSELSGCLLHVLEHDSENLPDHAVGVLFLVAASLMRDHVNSVEKDILAARDIYQRR
jgi:hypothetical protein